MSTQAAAPAATETTAQSTAGTEAAPATPATATPATGATATGAEAPDVAALQAENERLKKEADNARVQAKAKVAQDAQRTQLLALAEAIGIELPKGEEETVDSLQTKLAAEANARKADLDQLAAAKRDHAVDRAAWTNQVPADKAEYLQFLLSKDAQFQGLDPNASDFQTSVETRVKALVNADPTFKATPGGATKSGSDTFSGAGGSGEVSQADFDKMSVMEQTNLYKTNPDLFARLAGQA